MLIFDLFLVFVSISLLGATFVPLLVEKSSQMNKDQAQAVVGRVDRYMREEELKENVPTDPFGPHCLRALPGSFFSLKEEN